jgi:hypothetical protein
MNSSHIATTGGLTGLLTVVLIHLTHWPLQPLDNTTAPAYAGLVIAIGALLMGRKQNPPNGGGNGGAPSSTDSATKP